MQQERMLSASTHFRGGGAMHCPTKQARPKKSYEQHKCDAYERAMGVLDSMYIDKVQVDILQ